MEYGWLRANSVGDGLARTSTCGQSRWTGVVWEHPPAARRWAAGIGTRNTAVLCLVLASGERNLAAVQRRAACRFARNLVCHV